MSNYHLSMLMMAIHCRQENSSIYELPRELSFEVQNILSQQAQSKHLFHSMKPEEGTTWWTPGRIPCFQSALNYEAIIPLNRANSGDHNSVITILIPALEDEIRNLPGFLFTSSIRAMPTIQSMYYMSSERSFQLEYNAVEIVGNGPVVMEKFWN